MLLANFTLILFSVICTKKQKKQLKSANLIVIPSNAAHSKWKRYNDAKKAKKKKTSVFFKTTRFIYESNKKEWLE